MCICLVTLTPILYTASAFVGPFRLSILKIDYGLLDSSQEPRYHIDRDMKEKLKALIERVEANRSFTAYKYGYLFCNLSMAVLSFICGCALWARRDWALGITKCFLWAALTFSLAFAIVEPMLANLPSASELLADSHGRINVCSLLGLLLTFSLWYGYLSKSERVKNTQWEESAVNESFIGRIRQWLKDN